MRSISGRNAMAICKENRSDVTIPIQICQKYNEKCPEDLD